MPASTLVATLVWLLLVTALVAWALTASAVPAALIAFCVATSVLWITGLRAAALWGRAAARGRGAVVGRAAARGRAAAVGPGAARGRGAVGPGAARGHAAAVAPASTSLRIALLYCVADDADLAAMAASMRQDVAVATVILDDSRTAAARARIDAFAAHHGCRVIRRVDRSGFKAGNLNHGLTALRGRFDAYLLCDSDVILPEDLARVCAAALADPTVAIAQAAPLARAGSTWFARYFGPLLGTHVGVTRAGREARGVAIFLGRGALVRASALDDVGGVPTAVAEDLALTVALRRRGWRVVNVDAQFAEDYPVDYRSFRTQMRKTTEGAVEFLRGHLRPGRLRGVPGREARDLLLETALVPAAALAGVVALVSGAVLAATGTPAPLWVGAVAVAGAAMPLLPEAVRRVRARGFAAGLVFTALGGALYASTMFVVLGAALRTLLGGRAVFWVTPKTTAQLGVRAGFALLWPELTVAPGLMLIVALAAGSPLFAAAAAGPLLLALAFSVPMLRVRAPRRAQLLQNGAERVVSAPKAARGVRIGGVVHGRSRRPVPATAGVGPRA